MNRRFIGPSDDPPEDPNDAIIELADAILEMPGLRVNVLGVPILMNNIVFEIDSSEVDGELVKYFDDSGRCLIVNTSTKQCKYLTADEAENGVKNDNWSPNRYSSQDHCRDDC